jgi:TM2 domain-containing membrane protein YozV
MSFSTPNGANSEFEFAESSSPTPNSIARIDPAPIATSMAQPAPGWYVEPGKPGVLRYWNGTGWEEWRKPLVEAPSVTQGQKSLAVAYLLAFFIGGLGIHNFYLGRTGAGVGMLVLWILGVLTAGFLVGFFLLAAVGIWLIVDLCLIPSYVRTSALRAVGHRA